MNECKLSRFCKKHNKTTNRVFNIGLMTGFLKVEMISKDNDVKEMLCQIINDRAINKICECDGLTIEVLEEIYYDKQNSVLGTNHNYNEKIQMVIKHNDKILNYNELISILIHELVHTKYRDHGTDFIEYEKELRNKYMKYVDEFYMIKPWEPKFEFCTSLGAHIKIKTIDNEINNNIVILIVITIVTLIAIIYFM